MAKGIGQQAKRPGAVGDALGSAFAVADAWFADGRELFEWTAAPAQDLAGLVLELLYHNFQVWHYEDYGRTGDDRLILIGWRGAMHHNRHRNESINAIDAMHAGCHAPHAPLHSESLGALVDRLTILFLKHKNYQRRCTATADAVRTQLDELVDYAVDLQARLLGGQVRCQQVPRLKLYLEPARQQG